MAYTLSPRDILGAARLQVWEDHPYFVSLLFALRMVERKGINTLAVDDKMRLFYDPEFVKKIGLKYARTILSHEVQHVLREHDRRARVMERSGFRALYERVKMAMLKLYGFTTWEHFLNVVGDCEINDDIRHLPTPPEFPPALPELYGLPKDGTMEDYALNLMKKAEKFMQQPPPPQPQPQQTDEEQDESEGGMSMPSNASGDDDADDEQEEEEESEGSPEDEAGDGERDGEQDSDGADGEGEGESDDDPGDMDGGEEEGRGDGDSDADSGEGDGGTGSAGMESEPKGHVGGGLCGSCSGRERSQSEVEDADTPEGVDEGGKEVIKMQVAQEIRGCDSKGNMPAGWLLDWANKRFEPPVVDWRSVLAMQIRGAVSVARGHIDWKVGPPSRRRSVLVALGHGDEAPILPVLRGPQPRVVFAMDTSGSMGAGPNSRLDAALNEVYGITKAQSHDCGLFGMAVDAKVHVMKEIRTNQDLLDLRRGGGGTDMRVGIAEAAEPKHRADVIILLTDGETDWPTLDAMPRHAKLVTVIVNERKQSFESMPPYMKQSAIYVPLKERVYA